MLHYKSNEPCCNTDDIIVSGVGIIIPETYVGILSVYRRSFGTKNNFKKLGFNGVLVTHLRITTEEGCGVIKIQECMEHICIRTYNASCMALK
ncbi:hypothetical protein CEXT_426801 [Caerostris extrusa]|uniref:Uncharacterized protein n=1 Tax=Caerostris extrusa TaxID=172846 RepID=A0AAV4XP14_CAEEX|nr:hypothetical protein CEXT_426801 [Caerostris extrusa]